jgi:hypothetical protein
MNRPLSLMIFAALACVAGRVYSDDAPAQPALTKHQMMKQCMAKQKASDGGMPKEDMKKTCKQVTKTEKENADAERANVDRSNTTAVAPRD